MHHYHNVTKEELFTKATELSLNDFRKMISDYRH